MGDVIRFPAAKVPTTSRMCRAASDPIVASARPDVGVVRLTLNGVEHCVDAADALLLAAEICASAADAYELEREAKGG